MKRVAIFGKPGGGKSTLAKQLAAATGLPVVALDLLQYNSDGSQVSAEEFSQLHAQAIAQEHWIIDGLGTLPSFWQRLEAADTLVYLDLPYARHYWWVTKRLLASVVKKPEGWPEGSSVFKGTLASWRFLRLSPKFWTDDLFSKIQATAPNANIYRIQSVKQLKFFLAKTATKP